MLLFVADEPTPENEIEGMMQRIKWVDNLVADRPRTILSIKVRGNLRKQRIARTDKLTVEQLNLLLHFRRILKLARKSDVIYVHTCAHAFRILPLYFLGLRIITDLHGVVPEEEEMKGNHALASFFSLVERIVIRKGSAVVFVTNAMREHFARKYGALPQSFVIPILSPDEPQSVVPIRDKRLVIYSGGTHRWQLVDEMVESVRKANTNYRYMFLTSHPQVIQAMLSERGMSGANVEVGSVPRTEISNRLLRASLGFVLRNKSVVNEVACPTKLVEYLLYGVVPIVKFRDLGDFMEMGYKFIDVADFEKGDVPRDEELEEMRSHNRAVMKQLAAQGDRAAHDLMASFF
jgi:hypothetical protein